MSFYVLLCHFPHFISFYLIYVILSHSMSFNITYHHLILLFVIQCSFPEMLNKSKHNYIERYNVV